MTSGEHTKGHTELPWMAAAAYSSVCGVPIVNQQGRRIANTALPNMPKEWDELKQQAVIDAAFIVTAVNTYPAAAELVKALERAQKLVRLVTVRQAIDSGDDAIEAAGLNPWAMNEGLAEGSERIDAYFIDSALTRFREAQAGGGA